MWNDRIQFGIEKPEKEPASIDEMRKAITVALHHSALVRNAMMAADHQGMSGEDRHVLLAYHALRQLEDTHRRLLQFVNIKPSIRLNDGTMVDLNRG